MSTGTNAPRSATTANRPPATSRANARSRTSPRTACPCPSPNSSGATSTCRTTCNSTRYPPPHPVLQPPHQQLRGGRRQHLPLRLLPRVPALGTHSPRLQTGVAGRNPRREQQTGGLHHGGACDCAGGEGQDQDGRDQLLVRAQGPSGQQIGGLAHFGGHPQSQPQGQVAGCNS